VDGGLTRYVLSLFGCAIPEGRVDASTIMVAFDVAEQVTPCFIAGGPAVLVDELDLEGVEEAFHGGVPVAVAGAAHGRNGANRGKLIDVGLWCELAAAVRVVDQPTRRPLPLDGHHQSNGPSSVRMWSRMAQPRVFRVARSKTAAR
jgi:hypothetical protein